MIRNTYAATRFTQVFILCFRVITPLAFIYFGVKSVASDTISLRLSLYVEIYLATEICFYLLIYLPARSSTQLARIPSKTLTDEDRWDLFQKCIRTIPNAEQFIIQWTGAEKLDDVGRDDLKDWLKWSMFDNSQSDIDAAATDMDLFVQSIENMLEPYQLKPGRRGIKINRPSVDRVKTLHRPLLYYACGVAGSDFVSYAWMKWHGFDFHPLRKWITSVPPRPQTLLCHARSPATHIAYWYRPHTSKSRLPILYIHGIGILHTYLKFFSDLTYDLNQEADDGDVGILILDVGPISFRLTHDLPTADVFCEEMLHILAKHNYLEHKFLLVANSFGTALSVQMLKHPISSACIADVIWIDPCVFLLHLPEMTYNFLRRKPKSASEWQLWYFASRDIGAAHTLARRFPWTDSIVWKEQLIASDGIWATTEVKQMNPTNKKGVHTNGNLTVPNGVSNTQLTNNISPRRRRRRNWTIVLSADDIIVDTFTVGKYLTRPPHMRAVDDKRDFNELMKSMTVINYRQASDETVPVIREQGGSRDSHLEVLWFERLNHAETMDFRCTRKVLTDRIARDCLRSDG